MNNQFNLLPSSVSEKLAVSEIIHCNQTTSRYGLTISEEEASQLVKTRNEVLDQVGRIEFAGGIINKLMIEFCDSPYLSQYNYAETLHELIETFYYFKNETHDELDDDELIVFMKKSFDNTCQGSIDLLQTRDLENLARRIRFGITDLECPDEDLEGVFEDDTWVNEPDDDPYDPWGCRSEEDDYEGIF